MAYKASDGTPFTNAPQMRAHNQKITVQPAVGRAKPEARQEIDNEREMPAQDPSEVVAEHGPAHKVEISHDEDKHTVTSHHKDGHSHTSEHASKAEAHDVAKTLDGTDQEQEDPEQSDNTSEPDSPIQAMLG